MQRRLGGQPFSPLDLASALTRRPTSLGEAMGAAFEQGVADSPILGGSLPPLIPNVGTFVEESMEDWRAMNPPGTVLSPEDEAAQRAYFARQAEERRNDFTAVDQATWAASPHFREGIPYEDGMTVERAAALAERFDEFQYRQWLIDNHEGIGFGISTVGTFLAGVAGGAADPTNFIPVAGPVMRAAAIARLGRVGGRAAIGALEGTVGSAAVLPFVNQSRRLIGQEMSTADMILDVLMGTVAGAAFGGVAGAGAARSEARAARMLTSLRVADEALAKTRLAMNQIAAGERVEVPPVSRAVRDDLLRGLSVEERVRFLTAERATAMQQAEGVLGRLIAEDDGAPPPRLREATVTRTELLAIRGTLEEKAEARAILDAEREERVAARRAAEPGRTGREALQALRDIDQPEIAARERAEADDIAGLLRESIAPKGDRVRVSNLTKLERMAISDPSARMRALARAEIDRRMGEDGTPVIPSASRLSMPGATKAVRPTQPTDPVAARTPSTGDPAVDIDTKAEIEAIAADHGIDPEGNFAEMADFERMQRDGLLTPEEVTAFETATAEMQKVANAEAAYGEAAACLLRAAA